MNTLSKVLLAGIALLNAESATGQYGPSLSGSVFRHNPNGPAPIAASGYQVYLFSGATRQWLGPVLTDSHGRYAFYQVPAGHYLLQINAGGQAVWKQEVQVPGGIAAIVF